MGSYGIGPARLMGAIVEALSDEKGIIWPREVAPFAVHLVSITSGNAEVVNEAERLYELLTEHKIGVFYDDRDIRAGEKFADSDLIGIPLRMVISESACFLLFRERAREIFKDRGRSGGLITGERKDNSHAGE